MNVIEEIHDALDRAEVMDGYQHDDVVVLIRPSVQDAICRFRDAPFYFYHPAFTWNDDKRLFGFQLITSRDIADDFMVAKIVCRADTARSEAREGGAK